MGLTVEEQFHAATAIVGFVIGLGSQMAEAQSRVVGTVSRTAYLEAAAARWKEVDPEELPFMHAASSILLDHDDDDQFIFGLDLLLDGIRGRVA